MIKYSIVMRGNPADETAEKKAYACAQYTEIMDLNDFAAHIASHGSVYSRADIAAVLTSAVDCMREQLLNGNRIQLGDLGTFYVAFKCTGADSAADFNPSVNITKVKVNWRPGEDFNDLLDDADFELVATRAAARAVVKALKAGETIVDLTATSTSSSDSTDDSTSSSDSTDDSTGSSTDTTDESGDEDESSPLG